MFKLTIADDEIEKKTEGYYNLMSMLNGFVMALAVTTVSGFWYLLVPRHFNWNASQTVLVLHLAGGGISLFLFLFYFFLHQRDQRQRWAWLFTPWRLRRGADEEMRHFRQRQLGHLLTWVFLTVYASGLVIALPGLLFYLGIVWMQGYYVSQVLDRIHLWGGVILIPLLFTHMLWSARKGVR